MFDTELVYYVRNWWKYQHYIDRRPPWIKLHRSIETDPDFQSLSEINQYRLIKFWLLASDLDGTWRGLTSYLTRTWRLHKHSNTSQVLAEFESKGLISKQDVRGLKRSNASASQRQSRDREREEKNNPPTPLKKGEQVLPQKPNVKPKPLRPGEIRPYAEWRAEVIEIVKGRIDSGMSLDKCTDLTSMFDQAMLQEIKNYAGMTH